MDVGAALSLLGSDSVGLGGSTPSSGGCGKSRSILAAADWPTLDALALDEINKTINLYPRPTNSDVTSILLVLTCNAIC